MSKAYIDTTVLADILLKSSQEKGKNAKESLGRYDETELPVYAIKEFKAGPLQKYMYVHNKFLVTESFAKTLEAISKLPPFQSRRKSTSLEAIAEAASLSGQITSQALVEKYGAKAKQDSVQCDQFRYSLRYIIEKSWEKRREVASQVVNELSCYEEVAPYEKRGALVWKPTKCKEDKVECCMAKDLRNKIDDLIKIRATIDQESKRLEDIARRQTLKKLIKRPKDLMTEDMCKSLGDAVFAIFAPHDATILTTNIRDHEPLAQALGKKAKSPQPPS